MKAGALTMMFGTALVVGWLAPDLKTSDGNGPRHVAELPAHTDEQVRLDVAQSDRWQDGQGVLTRQRDGHFYTNASVDGAQVRFLVDTGASIVALTGEDAAALGLDWSDADLKPIGRGANGVVNGIHVRIERMEVAGIEAQGVEAAIIPEGLDVSLLGQSFLARVRNLQINGDEMRLES
ncbi:MAG: TIGR02281 family clan AA aspartic protease [Novosphingobium sp.]|nr:TIGR02281 family clan AA aspartic protease [Novosphingobium sp.]